MSLKKPMSMRQSMPDTSGVNDCQTAPEPGSVRALMPLS
jgi:hypothetical protein